MSLQIVILAAGSGKRMFSSLPKVLHPLAGKPMLRRIVETAQQLKPEAITVVYGQGGEQVREALADLPIRWVLQEKPMGTGHAVIQALPGMPDEAQVLVLAADVPLISKATLEALVDKANLDSGHIETLALLLATVPDPHGLGRIIRNENQSIKAIVEEKDATFEQKQIKEIYTGILCAQRSLLINWLPKLQNNNAQGEYYLPDIIAMAVAENKPILSISCADLIEIQGVNNRVQLERLERIWQRRQAELFMLNGVTIADANRVDIRGELRCGQDVTIDVNCIFQGSVVLGNNCTIGPNCYLSDVVVEAGTVIHANSVLEGSEIGPDCQIGPFARLRPGTRLKRGCKIGNFVETKQAEFGECSKAPHLSYLGDIRLGSEVNIGAGTITCNYDGANKHHTEIGDGVFVGSDTQLVAPVTVGSGATIGAGSTIRKDVPANELTLTKSQQVTVAGWKRPKK